MVKRPIGAIQGPFDEQRTQDLFRKAWQDRRADYDWPLRSQRYSMLLAKALESTLSTALATAPASYFVLYDQASDPRDSLPIASCGYALIEDSFYWAAGVYVHPSYRFRRLGETAVQAVWEGQRDRPSIALVNRRLQPSASKGWVGIWEQLGFFDVSESLGAAEGVASNFLAAASQCLAVSRLFYRPQCPG